MRTQKSTWFMLVCLLLCFIPILAQGKEGDGRFKAITIVLDDNYPPYIFRNSNGHIQGILVDEWALWEKKTGIKVNLTAMDWSKAQEFMRKGQADVIDTIFFNEKRALAYDFTKPYATLDVPVFFNKNISGIVNIPSLQGLTIGVKAGDACIDVLKKQGITSLQEYNSYESIIQAAASGQIKVFSIDKPPALYYLYKMNLENEFRYSLTLYTGKFHRAVQKGRTDILKAVEGGFALITKKEHDAIQKKWMGEPLLRPEYFRYISFFLLFVGVIFLVLLFFNATLRRNVRVKTAELQETINQLGLSEERFRIMFEQAAVGVALCDSKSGGYIKVNQKYCDIVGYTPEEIKQLCFQDITHPKDVQENLESMTLLLEGKIREFSIEKRFYRKDSNIVWVKLTVSPMWKEGEKPTSHIAIVEDITKNKRKENVQAAQLNLVEYAQTHPVKEVLQRVLDEAETLTDSEIGFFHFVEDDQKTLSLQTGSKNRIANHHYPISQAKIWADCLGERKPIIYNDDATLKHKRDLPEGHAPIVRELVVPVLRGEKIMAVLGVGNKKNNYETHDAETVQQIADMAWETITRKRAEEDVVKHEFFLNTIIENIPIMLFVKDAADLKFVRFNKAGEKLIGFSKEELIGKNDYDFFPQPEADFFTQKDQETLRSGELLDIQEETIQTKKQGERILHTKKIPIFDQNGKPEFLLGISEDITEIKKNELERIKAQQTAAEQEKLALVGQIAGKMAHDFNNILGIIMGNTELALIDCPDDQIKERLELIYNQTFRGKNLTKNLVAFAKDQEPKQEFFSIDEKIDLVLNLLKKDLEGIKVIRQYGYGMPELLADSGMIEHAIVNLFQNSIHAASLVERPEIIVGTHHQEDLIFIEIEDNGCGIPPEFLGEIYEPSFTLKGSKDKNGMYKPGIKGTGYGMSNVKKYIEQHKGTISIQSELQKGTKVAITLPVVKKELTEEEIAAVKKETLCFEKYILLVEDEQAISDVQYRILTHEPCNHKVDIANNGQVAMDLLNRNEYQLLSLDYVLPGKLNGMDVYLHFREKNKTVPVLFISGNIEFLESIKELKQKDPYIDHLSKPCKNIDYVNCINKLLERVTI
ncbi:MAG: PAS domain S-box protein [Desulfobacula sp.]|nr:PAS domain S-box protein [Desulfobacula sp.]